MITIPEREAFYLTYRHGACLQRVSSIPDRPEIAVETANL